MRIDLNGRVRRQEEKRAELSQYFPIFLWVLRDFHLTLQDDKGGAMTEKEYLERALSAVPGQEETWHRSSWASGNLLIQDWLGRV